MNKKFILACVFLALAGASRDFFAAGVMSARQSTFNPFILIIRNGLIASVNDCLSSVKHHGCINWINGEGHTPLWYAMARKNQEIIDLLLGAGAKLSDEEWHTPLERMNQSLAGAHGNNILLGRGLVATGVIAMLATSRYYRKNINHFFRNGFKKIKQWNMSKRSDECSKIDGTIRVS